jgi:inositol oxygenase
MMKRNYNDVPEGVKECYRDMRAKQDLETVTYLTLKYGQPCGLELNVWDALESLNSFVDLSDPDMNLPNMVHMLQTAEGIKKAGEPEWMQLVGLIHDLGKCIYLRGNDNDGTSLERQWAIVGDTFIVGEPLPDKLVYSEFNSLNKDCQRQIYPRECGMSKVLTSYGHDEYLYQVLLRHDHNLPLQALYMIRYHSLYAWHQDGCYRDLEDQCDRDMKPWVQRFNKYDLYTKDNNCQLDIETLKPYYMNLIETYLGKKPLKL